MHEFKIFNQVYINGKQNILQLLKLFQMSKRTQSQYEYNHRNSKEEPVNTQPGQIYLKSYKQLTQENQQLIMSIHQLRNKNEEINNKIGEKIKISKTHLEKHMPNNNLSSKQNEEKKQNREKLQNKQTGTPEKYLHNKFYRKYNQPLPSPHILQQIKINNKNSNEQKLFTNLIKEAKTVKQRNNSAYRIIKQSHLRSLEQIEKEENKKTEKKKPTFDKFDEEVQSTPLKNKTSEKYLAKTPETKAPEPSIKKTQKNLVYLPIPKECKQQIVERANKKINELKPKVPKKKPKDNSPYKAGLKRTEKQNSVYCLGSQYQEIDSDEQYEKMFNK